MQAAQALVAAQNGASAEFFGQSTHALVMLRRMLSISVVALLVFTSLLGALAYATFVAPLRAMLVQSQSVLERHEKLAALGTLAAGVAHEIRNPLQAIKMRLFSLKRSLPEAWRDDEDLEIISSEINRLEKIVKDTLQFARPGEPELAVLPVADMIGAVAQLLEGSLQKRGIELKADVAEPVFVRADRRQIQQVLINLVLNAAESIEGAGAVTIRVAADESRETGEWPAVCIEIADTGRGIPPEIERRLFDPFFSTKEGGTGLGLSIAERIVERHGGCIQYSSQLGRGTTFKVILPRHAQHERANSAD